MHGTEPWPRLDRNKIVAVQPLGRFKADNAPALATVAVMGLGIARLPDCYTYEDFVSGALVQVIPDSTPPAGAYVIHPPSQHPSRKISILTEAMITYFGKDPEVGSLDRSAETAG